MPPPADTKTRRYGSAAKPLFVGDLRVAAGRSRGAVGVVLAMLVEGSDLDIDFVALDAFRVEAGFALLAVGFGLLVLVALAFRDF